MAPPKKSPAVPAAKLVAITFHVQDPISQPINGATVELVGVASRTTDPQGNVTLKVPAGTFDLKVRKAAHSTLPPSVPFKDQEFRNSTFVVPAAGLPTQVFTLTTNVVFVAVQVVDPLAVGIPGVEVELANLGFIKRNTDRFGIAMFGAQPPGSLDIKARKTDLGPFPAPGGVFTLGEQRQPRSHTNVGALQTFVIEMATIKGLTLSAVATNPSFPQRIFKGAAGTTDTDKDLTVAVDCPAGAGKHIPVKVDFTFTSEAGNAPKAKGGKDNTDVHFAQSGAFAMTGGGLTTAQITTDAAGQGKIVFKASVTSGDGYVVRAAINRPPHDPTGTLRGEIRHDDKRFEVWKRLDYNNLFRMKTGASIGVDVNALCVEANIQPAYTPCFTEYHKGAVHDIAFQEFISNLVPPTAAQLPISSRIGVRSNGPDTRAVTVHGLKVAADGSTSVGTEVLTLSGTSGRSTTSEFQRVDRVTVAADPARTISIDLSTGPPIATIGPGATSHVFAPLLFDTAAAVKTKAQSWCDANEAAVTAGATALRTAIGAVGFHLVGAAFDHPKHDGRPTSGITTFYAAYPTVRIRVDQGDFHPDAKWSNVQGFNHGQMSVIFKNSSGARSIIVARHEIGHASDHVDFSLPGGPHHDTAHCDQPSCLMFFTGGSNQFCTIEPDHSIKRMKGISR